jgi:hypothetical protein
MGVEADILAQGPPGLRGEILSWRQLKTWSLFIVQQAVGEKSALLGEGESVGRKPRQVAPVSDWIGARTAN